MTELASSQLRALGDAVRTISAAASRDPSAVLEELRTEAETLLGCDNAGIHLAEVSSDGLVFRRVYVSPFAAARGAARAAPWSPPPPIRGPISAGRAVFFEDFQAALPGVADRPWVAGVSSALYAPLMADDELVGLLFAGWFRPRKCDDQLMIGAEALGRCAAVAVRTARLLTQAKQAREQLEAVLDAADDPIIVFANDGTILRANRWAREKLFAGLPEIPATAEEMRRVLRPTHPDGEEAPLMSAEKALRGERAEAQLNFGGRLLHTRAALIVDAAGEVQGAIGIGRDITELRQAITDRAKLDGAVKTARRIAHELNNSLTYLLGYGELLAAKVRGEEADYAKKILKAAEEAATFVQRLQGLTRFEETGIPGIEMLDLDAATEKSPPA